MKKNGRPDELPGHDSWWVCEEIVDYYWKNRKEVRDE